MSTGTIMSLPKGYVGKARVQEGGVHCWTSERNPDGTYGTLVGRLLEGTIVTVLGAALDNGRTVIVETLDGRKLRVTRGCLEKLG